MTLTNTGYGQIQGEGAEMKYTAMPPPKIDIDDAELTRSSIPVPQAAQVVSPPVDTIDIPPEPIAESSSSYQDGMAVEVWRADKWHPAKYIGTVLNSVLSHITRKLDDGHLVKFRHSSDPVTRVASTDLRLAQSAYP